jgi:hypothetical protein
VLGLLAAANSDADPTDFTKEEADYAKELARRAKTSGDKRFAGEDLERIYRIIDRADALDSRFNEMFKAGERETRAKQFLTGTEQTKFLLGDYLKPLGKFTSGGAANPVEFYKD